MTTIEEIKDILAIEGDAYSGGNDEQCEQITREWQEAFGDVATIREWIDAGYWDAATARKVAGAGYTPQHKPEFIEPREYASPIYALCNRDVRISDLDWT